MQCASCGTELPRGAAHCPSCGTISSDQISHAGILPDDLTTVSSPYSADEPAPVPTNYGSVPPQNPYSLTTPIPPPLPPRHRVKIGLVIGILALASIFVSGIGVFAWLAQRVTSNPQNAPISSNNVTATVIITPHVTGGFDTSFYYRLTNNFLGMDQSLDVRSDGSYLLKMAQTGNYSGQFWKLVDLSAGKYALRTAYLGDGFSLGVINDGTNTTPQMKATGNYSGQFWSLVPWGDGTYRLTNDFTGPEKHLDTYSDTHEPFLGTGNHTGQHWTLIPLTKISE